MADGYEAGSWVARGDGVLLFLGGQGLLYWGMQWAPSGYSALLYASLPLWTAALEAVLDRRLPTWGATVPLLVGFGGVALLTEARGTAVTGGGILALLALLLAPMSWAVGALLQRRKPVQATVVVSSAYQMFFGSVASALVAIAAGEPSPNAALSVWLALGYLAVFGAVIGFAAFAMALRALPASVVMTYTYVNPVIAVVLGAVFVNESLSPSTLVAASLVILGVVGVIRNQTKSARGSAAEVGPPPTRRPATGREAAVVSVGGGAKRP